MKFFVLILLLLAVVSVKETYESSTRDAEEREFLNCFGLGDWADEKIDNYLKIDANGAKASEINFYFTSRNNRNRILLKHTDTSFLDKINFDARREKSILIVHGYKSKGVDRWVRDMENAFLAWKDVNVFSVDWRSISDSLFYYKAAVNTRTVGQQISTIFDNLAKEVINRQESDPSKWGSLYFVGHSLGAHVSAYASRDLKKNNSPWKIQRITGLDPAQPCFKNATKSLYLDKSDADFVDVIHTNGRELSKFGLGLVKPLGHVDFYPNGGKVQPGCAKADLIARKKGNVFNRNIKSILCNHGRSHAFFIESIYSAIANNCTFWANEWNMSEESAGFLVDKQRNNQGCGPMGINADKGSCNGTCFVATSATAPYCKIDNVKTEDIESLLRHHRQK